MLPVTMTRDLVEVEARERLAAIIASSDDAIVGKTIDGVIQTWNAAAERMFGYTADEVVGRHVSIIIPDHLLNEEEEILRNIRAGKRIAHFETVRRRKDGSLVDVSLTISPIHGPNGEVLGASKIARDITPQRAAQKALADLNEKLEEKVRTRTAALQRSMREVESFNHAVAHDLRTPLRAILGFSRALARSKNLTGDEREQLHFIIEESQQMSRITEALLKLSRIRSDRLVRAPVDLTALAQRIGARLQQRDPSRRVQIRVGEGLRASADPVLARILVENLFDNAWKFTAKRANPMVTFGAAEHNGTRMLFVQDNGVGFRPEDGTRILGGFQRLRPEEFEGSGIGLTTVNQIVQAHEGQLIAEGCPGEGATMWFTLERTSAGAAEPHST